MKRIIFFVLSLFMFVSCKKEVNIESESYVNGQSGYDTTFVENFSLDTLYPSDYLMYYPGSFWEYDNGTIYDSLDWGLTPIYQSNLIGNSLTITVDKVYIPYGYLGHVYNNYRVVNSNYQTNFIKILDTIVGEIYSSNSYSGSGKESNTHKLRVEVVELHDSLIVNGVVYYDVIQTEQRSSVFFPAFPGGPPESITVNYFAKNVGLIKRIDSSALFPTAHMNLVNYYIAPH